LPRRSIWPLHCLLVPPHCSLPSARFARAQCRLFEAVGAPSALGVAEEGADDAFLRALAITAAKRPVLGGTKPGRFAPPVPPARIRIIDRKRRAAVFDRRDHATT